MSQGKKSILKCINTLILTFRFIQKSLDSLNSKIDSVNSSLNSSINIINSKIDSITPFSLKNGTVKKVVIAPLELNPF